MLTYLTTLAGSIVHRNDEDGQGLAEYALILALIAIVAIVALVFLGGQTSDKVSTIGDTLSGVQALIRKPAGRPGGLSIPRCPPAI